MQYTNPHFARMTPEELSNEIAKTFAKILAVKMGFALGGIALSRYLSSR